MVRISAPFTFVPAKALVAGLAVLLLILALWQGIDSAVRLFGASDRDIATTDNPRTLADSAAMLEHIDDWLWDPQAMTRAGLVYFRLSLPSRPDLPPDHGALAQSIADLTSGLARAPADAKAWMALAHAELAAGDFAMGKRAFRTSLLTALYDPTLTLWRCQLGLGLWPLLDEDDRRLVANQLRMAWTRQPAELLGLAKAGGNADIIAAALDQDPAERSAFEKALKR